MLVSISELSGVSLDWAYELASDSDASDMRVRNGGIEIYILDDYHPPGWYIYQRRRSGNDQKDRDFVKTYIRQLFIEIPDELWASTKTITTT